MSDSLPLHYIDLKPKNLPESGKAPVILMLHGYGSHENDLFSFAHDLNENHHVISLRAPLRLSFGGFAWYEINWNASGDKWTDVEAGLKSIETLTHFIDHLEQNFDVDATNITLMGFSQGAIMSYAYSFRHPEKLKAVVAMSGYIVSELMPSKAPLALVQKLPYFITHGTQDGVIPVSWAEQGVEYLEKLQIPHTFRTYAMPHGINPQAYADVKAWLAENVGIGVV
ncbi:MAG: dienelactone hydrolase family protein [Flavobacteriia bacterium]|nr:dienelactone hydrolase family protein [Flavobacteriia bacterium]